MKFNYKLISTFLFFLTAQIVVAQEVSPQAIVRINSSYSGAVISDDGLVLTHSSLIRDRMGLLPGEVKPGFSAKTKEEEIEIKGFEIKFNEQVEDITDIILWMPTDTFTQARIDHEIQKNIFQYARLKKVKPEDIIHLPTTNTYLLNPTRSYVKIKLVEWPLAANWIKLRVYDKDNNALGTLAHFKTISSLNTTSQAGTLYTGGYPYNSQLWLPQPVRAALIKDFIPFKTEIRQQFLMAWSIGTLRAPDLKMFLDRLTDEYAQGCNKLIKIHKAALMQSAEDIGYIMRWEKDDSTNQPIQKNVFVNLSVNEEKIVEILRDQEGLTMDKLTYGLQMSIGQLTGLLLEMEFKGIVQSLPGSRYGLIR